jgi:hypothetical protein
MTPFLYSLSGLIEIPSILFVGFGSVMPIAVTRGSKRIQLLEGIRRISLPVGLIGSLVGFMMMLMNMSDPTAIEPAFRVMMFCIWYGVCTYGLTSWFLRSVSGDQVSGMVRPSLTGSIIVCGLYLMFLFSSLGVVWIDFSSIVFFLVGLPLLGLYKSEPSFSYRLVQNSIIISFFMMTYAATEMFFIFDDPTAIGPAMSVFLLSSLYGALITIGASPFVPGRLSKQLFRWQYLFIGINMLALHMMFYLIKNMF